MNERKGSYMAKSKAPLNGGYIYFIETVLELPRYSNGCKKRMGQNYHIPNAIGTH